MLTALLVAVVVAGNTAGDAPKWKLAPRPEQAVSAVLEDQAALLPSDRDCQRYVWAKSDAERLAVAGAINIGPSQSATTYAPRIVNDELLAIDLRAICCDAKLYDRLAIGEPFFHRLDYDVVPCEPWVAKDGKTYRTKRQTKAVSAYDQLFVGQVVSAGWFVRQSLGSIDGALYLDFRGLKVDKTKRADYLASRGAKGVSDFAKAKSTLLSKITGRDRELEVFHSTAANPTVATSIISQTGDHFEDDHLDAADTFRNLTDAKNDGFEIIAELPNGFPEYTLFAAATDLLVASAPDNLARDSTVVSPYCNRLHGAMSCIVCHLPDSGWRHTPDVIRTLQKGRLDILDQITRRKSSAEAIALIAAQHQSDTENAFTLARDSYNRVVIRACSPWIKEPKNAAIEFASAVRTVRDEEDYREISAEILLEHLGVVFLPVDDEKLESARHDAILEMLARLLPIVEPAAGEAVVVDSIEGFLKQDVHVAAAQERQILPVLLHRSSDGHRSLRDSQNNHAK